MLSLDKVILVRLQKMLHMHNPYVHVFQQVGELIKQDGSNTIAGHVWGVMRSRSADGSNGATFRLC